MRLFILQLFLFLSIASHGQRINGVFNTMPTQLLPGISDANRARLLASPVNTAVPYILGEVTKLQHTDNFLEIRTSAVGTMQIKLLPLPRSLRRNTTIIAVIHTVCGGGCNSHISFYTTRWERLDASRFLPDISVRNFLDSSQKETQNYKYALSLSNILPISAQFKESSTDITLTFNHQYLSAPAFNEMEPFLKTDRIVLQWRGGSFR